jgi:hypothetical protein
MKGEGLFNFYKAEYAALVSGIRRPSASATPDSRVDWRRRYDESLESETADHPDVPATVFEATNGPTPKCTMRKAASNISDTAMIEVAIAARRFEAEMRGARATPMLHQDEPGSRPVGPMGSRCRTPFPSAAQPSWRRRSGTIGRNKVTGLRPSLPIAAAGTGSGLIWSTGCHDRRSIPEKLGSF